MRFHCEPIPKEADMHPEDPRRIYEVYNELCQAGLVDDPANVDPNADFMLLRIPTRYATEHEIRACHSHKSWDFVMSLKGMSVFRQFSMELFVVLMYCNIRLG